MHYKPPIKNPQFDDQPPSLGEELTEALWVNGPYVELPACDEL